MTISKFKVTSTLRISLWLLASILQNNLNMCCIPAICLHYQLSNKKESHVNMRLDLQKRLKREPEFLLKISQVMCNKTWVYDTQWFFSHMHAVMHNKFYYTDTSWHLREKAWQKLREKCNIGIDLSITMTIHLLTLLCLHMNLWQEKKKKTVFPHPPYPQHLAMSFTQTEGKFI